MKFSGRFDYQIFDNKVLIIVLLLIGFLAPFHTAKAKDESLFSDQANDLKLAPKDCVILIHGLARSSGSMFFIARYLKQKHYAVVRVAYPSTDESIETLAAQYIPPALEECQTLTQGNIHFVTHSLGGILVRQFFQKEVPSNVRRVVMLSPPNKGSEVSDFLKDSILYRWLNGPAGQQLSTGAASLPNRLKPINLEVGVITGNSSYEPWFSRLSEGEDDGKVSVENARLEEMVDFLVVPNNHTFIMNDSSVKFQVDQFLRTGRFDRGSNKEIKPK